MDKENLLSRSFCKGRTQPKKDFSLSLPVANVYLLQASTELISMLIREFFLSITNVSEGFTTLLFYFRSIWFNSRQQHFEASSRFPKLWHQNPLTIEQFENINNLIRAIKPCLI